MSVLTSTWIDLTVFGSAKNVQQNNGVVRARRRFILVCDGSQKESWIIGLAALLESKVAPVN